jgi:hypothetical protein
LPPVIAIYYRSDSNSLLKVLFPEEELGIPVSIACEAWWLPAELKFSIMELS